MPQSSDFTLSDFIRELVASREDWEEWERVRKAAPPVTTTRPAPPTSHRMYLRETEPASSDFLRKQELERKFREDARALLHSGEWEAWGRTGGPATRQRLESVDIAQAALDFEGGKIGAYQHVQIRQAAPESNVETLKQFIEIVCRAVSQPRKKVTKAVIDDLAQALRKENYSIAAFQAAWEEARINPAWRKPGP